MNIFQRIFKFFQHIFKFFFPDKERKADRAQQQVGVPHPPLSSVGKKEKKKHRIEPDFLFAPKTFYFNKTKELQQIFFWDGEHFPGRWRHKIIHH